MESKIALVTGANRGICCNWREKRVCLSRSGGGYGRLVGNLSNDESTSKFFWDRWEIS